MQLGYAKDFHPQHLTVSPKLWVNVGTALVLRWYCGGIALVMRWLREGVEF